jgi:NADH-quinone oxidoreductase subunit D
MDLNQGKTILAGLPALETRARHYLDIVTNDAIFQQHTRNVGVMTRAQAEVLGVVGPLARAAGVPRDVRVEAPGAVYGTEPVTMTQESNGDLEARFKVHVRELSESLRLARLQLDNLQQGPISVPLTGNPPAGEAVVRVEAPEGELFYFLQSDGSPALARLKVRTPGERNLAACLRLTVGHPLKDVPVSLAGAFAERTGMERSVSLRNVVAGWERSVRWEELG